MWATFHVDCSNDIHHLSAFTWADWCLLMFCRFIAITFISLILSVQSVYAYEYVATIIEIKDGDTISALVHNEIIPIRLIGIDCFEAKRNKHAKLQSKYYGLPYDEIYKKGKQSKKILKNVLQNHRYIRVKWDKRDSFGRILGQIYLDDIKSSDVIDVNEYMLNQGGCNRYVPKEAMKKSKLTD